MASLLEHAPRFTVSDVVRLAWELYGIRATAIPLPSERDQNYLLCTEGNERYVLKMANALEGRALLEAQNQAMARLAGNEVLCPLVLPTKAGDENSALAFEPTDAIRSLGRPYRSFVAKKLTHPKLSKSAPPTKGPTCTSRYGRSQL